VIDSDSQDKYPLMDPIENFTYLRHGWNLISTPFIQPSTQLDDVLSQLKGSYKAVMRYNTTDLNDQWKNYLSVKPSHMNDLKTIDHTMGFWIYITESEDIVFDYSGIVPTQNQTINLCKGWNMVGYPSLSDKNRTQALNNLTFGQEIDAIWTYNVGAQKWEEVGEDNYFLVGKGYWMHATSDCVWEVPL
jgi:hypothetical protein